MSEKNNQEDSSNSSSASDDKSVVSREQEMKRKLAATRDMKMMMDHEDIHPMPDDGIDAFNMMPNALNTGMFESDIFGDLGDLDDDLNLNL
eukprot:CAMPEP_0113603382 /NCGR_PEP_ID=MMETSP0017_2-20120614/1248_1 /TAXON_ID=2856 /ORGANISM="Cylindrotheca closterium" /LENGTH=90 /DNA_ID=CAMNT_0000511769 /DNA_START=69 /DNA_END=341 /DNA_ORIENTATION=- /assembly_acc=CAM_ASM_000147